jgi:hypothetical protein
VAKADQCLLTAAVGSAGGALGGERPSEGRTARSVARLAAWPLLRVREAECKDNTGSCRAGQGFRIFARIMPLSLMFLPSLLPTPTKPCSGLQTVIAFHADDQRSYCGKRPHTSLNEAILSDWRMVVTITLGIATKI